jgi:phenylacetate-CoA ligase
VLERPRRLDTLTVRVETAPGTWAEAAEGRGAELGERVKDTIGLTIRVEVVAPGTLERSQGKARRVDDRRPSRLSAGG